MSEERPSPKSNDYSSLGDRDKKSSRNRDNSRNERRGKSHGNRGSDRKVRHDRSNPQRHGFREDRMAQKLSEPDLPDDIDIKDLDPMVLQDLRVLSKDNAERVAKHLIMSAVLIEDDTALALQHARAAKNRAGRVGVVREMNGIAAYHAGEWKEALSELRAARRMMGGPGLLAVMADCERGLGRPEKAVELARTPEARQLDPESRIELGIVVAGARRDLGQNDAAVATLQRLEPTKDPSSIPHLRLAYAYADALFAAGRKVEAKEWFAQVASNDEEELTDAAVRLDQLG
ncbi:tetratricopeptide repeat protein [Corynebacterium cystitidis]|uniref:Tetratricopeptide repeat-containing protein n=1 Tax=Corynebacterium cystitidis DSM 20524 TaxID=1121357 RepID=A0A1H9PXH7_9CORY|nr:hypothetical protein [Corynebacterium cystitidis]WJY82344.1 hypothetical protein CCYS_07095 [Corynebacterium cystitidis DSM 20524]SER52882.1 hypothetical protein SAMN05661109_00498 [Corynebacterium cystitidis DSM 20524]SNV76334.1 TPR-repeat-containing protein [Corynebacterium cystitidis]